MTSGYNFTLVKDPSRLDVRKYSFSQRTINVCNTLSTDTDCVHASDVNMFKNIIESISYDRIPDIEDDVHEVMWIRMQLHKLPRRFASIVIARIYHPANSDNSSMRE